MRPGYSVPSSFHQPFHHTFSSSWYFPGKVWFVPMRCLKPCWIRSQLTNLSATEVRPSEKKRPQDKIQRGNKAGRCWNALLCGTRFPRFQFKNICRPTFCLGEARCLKVRFRPVSKTVNHRNSAWAEQVASWGGWRGKKMVLIHLAMGISLLTTGFRSYVQVCTVQRPGICSEDIFKSLLSQKASNFHFLLQYH